MASDIKFGTDGWRGIIAWDFTFDKVRRLAQAVADFVNDNAPSSEEYKNTVVVGYDRRFLSDKFAEDIASIIRANKVDVTLLPGPVSTPVISTLTLEKYWLGVMVTASHNPAEYNGVKIKIAGGSAPERITKEIEDLIDQNPVLLLHGVKPAEKDLRSVYLKYLKSKVNMKRVNGLKGKVVFDYMYGSSAGLAEEFLPPAKVVSLRTEYDPSFKGIQPEPKDETLSELKARVVKEKAVLGIAFDGDGDRVAVVDEKGSYLTPCLVSAILLDYLIRHKKLSGSIVQTYSMGYLNKRIARHFNMPFEEVGIGFKHVAEKMAVEDVAFGVEESGGYSWKGMLPDRDGMCVALTLLDIMASTGKKASELVSDIVKNYGASIYIRKGYPLTKTVDKSAITDKLKKKMPKKIAGLKVESLHTTDGLKVILEEDQWLLIRPSGTEPVLRVYAESASKKLTEELLDFGYKQVLPLLK